MCVTKVETNAWIFSLGKSNELIPNICFLTNINFLLAEEVLIQHMWVNDVTRNTLFNQEYNELVLKRKKLILSVTTSDTHYNSTTWLCHYWKENRLSPQGKPQTFHC